MTLTKNQLHNSNQFGFEEELCSSDDEMSKLCNYFNLGQNYIGVFIELAKVFGIVNFKILIVKLMQIGIKRIAMDVIKSYLYERIQLVTINNALSNCIDITCGTLLAVLFSILHVNNTKTHVALGKLLVTLVTQQFCSQKIFGTCAW